MCAEQSLWRFDREAQALPQSTREESDNMSAKCNATRF